MSRDSDNAWEQMLGGKPADHARVNQPIEPAPAAAKPAQSRPLEAAARWGAIGVLGLVAVAAVVWVIVTNRTRPTITPSVAATAPQQAGGSHPATPGNPGSLLDINTATAAQLEHLPSIGPALAARIVADRAKHGRYTSIEQLDRVEGIGRKTIDKLRPHITVR